MSESVERTAPGWRWVSIKQDDTLQLIAYRELGDAARWSELAALNDLLPPYITGDPAIAAAALGRVLLYGQSVRVFSASSTAEAATDPTAIYGADMATDARGMLTAAGGDLAIVSGLANLGGALARRVITDRGELPFHPSYGSHVRQTLGRTNGPARAALAARSAQEAVARDSRVARVIGARVQAEGDRLAMDISLEPIASGERMTLRTEV